ncbi:MAG: energy transducer TonB [Longimicrobiales bacterium]|nr:energy transducer TonB [Longimicrobiales bacterium]
MSRIRHVVIVLVLCSAAVAVAEAQEVPGSDEVTGRYDREMLPKLALGELDRIGRAEEDLVSALVLLRGFAMADCGPEELDRETGLGLAEFSAKLARERPDLALYSTPAGAAVHPATKALLGWFAVFDCSTPQTQAAVGNLTRLLVQRGLDGWTGEADRPLAAEDRAEFEDVVGGSAAQQAEAPVTSLSERPQFTPMTQRPELQNRDAVAAAIQEHYPPVLREAGIERTVNVWFFIDEEGVVQNAVVNRSSGYPELDEAALEVAEVMRFSPALNRSEPVPVWVALDIAFAPR